MNASVQAARKKAVTPITAVTSRIDEGLRRNRVFYVVVTPVAKVDAVAAVCNQCNRAENYMVTHLIIKKQYCNCCSRCNHNNCLKPIYREERCEGIKNHIFHALDVYENGERIGVATAMIARDGLLNKTRELITEKGDTAQGGGVTYPSSSLAEQLADQPPAASNFPTFAQSRDLNVTRSSDVAQALVESLPKVADNNLIGRLQHELDQQYQQGKISESTYRGTAGEARSENLLPQPRRDSGRILQRSNPQPERVSAAPEPGLDSTSSPPAAVQDGNSVIPKTGTQSADLSSEAARQAVEARLVWCIEQK